MLHEFMMATGNGKGVGWRRHPPREALRWHLDRRKYAILKFGRFCQIAVCIADSNIFTPPNIP